MKKLIFSIFCFMVMCINCNADSVTKYYKTINNYKSSETYEISEQEYEEGISISVLNTIETTEYKKMNLHVTKTYAELTLTWDKLPKYRSYDVIALMGNNIKFQNSTIVGNQIATVNGKQSSVIYNSSTANTKLFNNGFGGRYEK